MYKYAQILDNKVHWIFQDAMTLTELYTFKYSPEIVLIDITENSLEVTEGWGYIDGDFINPAPPPPTPEEIQKQLTDAVQSYMDSKVRERGYDNIHTACSYAVSTSEKFKAEGEACVVWRDAVWLTCYAILDEVMAGQRDIPTVEELLNELPVLEW